MNLLRTTLVAALLVTPALAAAQDGASRIGHRQKAWMTANFRSAMTCSVPPGAGAVALAGDVSFDASDDGGLDLAVSSDGGGMPVVTAVAINSKGTGADKNRTLPAACPVAEPAAGTSSSSAAACVLSGDEQAPSVRLTIPLAVLGGSATAKNYVGHVTLIKQRTDGAGRWASKKGYDYYQAQSDMTALTKLASCDVSALSAKGGKPMIATYDLAVAKK